MEFSIEYYHTGYKPKLDNDKYAYFVDDANNDIMYKIVEDYLHQILAVDSQYQLRLFKRHTGTGPCVIYFRPDKVTYDLRVTNRNIHRTYAGEHDYTIIQVNPKPSLLSFE